MNPSKKKTILHAIKTEIRNNQSDFVSFNKFSFTEHYLGSDLIHVSV